LKRFLKRCIEETVLRLYNFIGRIYLKPILFLEWKLPPFKQINERALEYSFALNWLARLCPAEVLDVGTGRSAWPSIIASGGFRVTAIDRVRGYWQGGFLNRHYRVVNDDITNPKITRQFDLITCISVLEHIPDHERAVCEMFKLLKPGGHLVLTVPYNSQKYVDDVYLLEGSFHRKNVSYICQVFSDKEMGKWLEDNSATIIDQHFHEIFEGEFWSLGARIYPPRQVAKTERCHLACLIMQKK